MSLDDIMALPVSEWVESDAHLYLWVPSKLNREGKGVATAEAWGFDVVSEIVWNKPNFGMGRFPRPGHEIVLVCRRGKLPFTAPHNVHSVQRWNQVHHRGGHGKVHSAKPDGLMDLVEIASPGPYLELFSRRARLGWDTYGNESLHGGEAS
jgi:N6-adenosine-specific RNA methylase IME4